MQLNLDLEHVIDLVSYIGEPFPPEGEESLDTDDAVASAGCLGTPAINDDSFSHRYM